MKIKLKFAGQLLECEWEPTHLCIDETDEIRQGQKVMLIQDICPACKDGLVVYAQKISPKRIQLSFHTEWNSHFMPLSQIDD